MSFAYPASADAKTIKALDVGVALWAIVWIGLAIITAMEVRSLRQLSTSLVKSSDVLADTADVLAAIEDVPLVGSEVTEVQSSVRAAAENTRESGFQSRDNIEDLSVLLGILIFLVPFLPVVLLYLPLRLSWYGEVKALKAALQQSGDDPNFQRFLADRATQTLGFERLQELGISPWHPDPEHRRKDLAAAELERLGLLRRRR